MSVLQQLAAGYCVVFTLVVSMMFLTGWELRRRP
jgi:hypothetical protein